MVRVAPILIAGGFTCLGCAGITQHPAGLPATLPSETAAVASSDEIPASRQHAETFTTSLPVIATAAVAGQLFDDFRFNRRAVLTGDYFTAFVRFQSSQNEGIEVICQWVKEGETNVRFQSDLPLDEHNLVSQRLKEAIKREIETEKARQ
jgi:hypothetical protein